MECPKCRAAHDAAAVECPRCGVVFAKLARRAASEETLAVDRTPPPSAPARSSSGASAAAVVRGLAVLGLAVWTWRLASVPMGPAVTESVLHLPNLIFHEAGHVLLGVFGRFIGVLGGSLFQVAVPAIVCGAFLRQGDRFAAAVCCWWAGQNLLDVAPYIADARALQLVLLGGQTGAEVEGHDWEYLLTQMNLLHRDRALGLSAHWLGASIMIAALVWAGMSVRRQSRSDDRD